MAEEKNLERLITEMSPRLNPKDYVFITLPGVYGDHAHLKPLSAFREKEGLTLIIEKEKAAKNRIEYDDTYKMITLEVHSSLNAVGLTAAVSGKLTEKGISANVVAAYFHDHIFVHSSLADIAMEALEELTAGINYE